MDQVSLGDWTQFFVALTGVLAGLGVALRYGIQLARQVYVTTQLIERVLDKLMDLPPPTP